MIERGRVWPEPADEDDAAIVMEAIAYLRRIETLTAVPIAMVSTGPDRTETLVMHHPFH